MNLAKKTVAFILIFIAPHAMGETSVSNAWWEMPYPSTFDTSNLKPQPFISVKGNKLIDESGQQVVLKGMNIADPDKIIQEGKWNKALFEELHRWGVDTIRLPIHPIAWRQRGEDGYFKAIDEAVVWANDLGIYLIIDWHSIGYLPDELYQHSMYDTTIKETKIFWKKIAFRYQNVPTIAVYEIFNEPTDQGGRAGKSDWLEWKAMNEDIIDIIYAHDRSIIPLVAGFNWAYDLRPIAKAPIERDGVAYAVHPYPQKAKPLVRNKQNLFALWEEVWGFMAKDYPLMATELGWVQPDSFGAHIPVKDDGSYGPMIIEFMDERDISYTGWVFDPLWSPRMILDWDFTPSEQGKFFKQVLQNK